MSGAISLPPLHASMVWTRISPFFSQGMGFKCKHQTDITRTFIFNMRVIRNRKKIKQNIKKSLLIVTEVNVKFTLQQATKAQRGSRGIALLFL
jgi:hypothetical protein